MNLFIFGLGYAGLAVAQAALAQECQVTGTVRSTGKALKTADFGGRIIALDHPQAYRQIVEDFKNTTHVLSTVPPDRNGDPIMREFAAVLQAAPHLKWAGVLSATSVYGDTGGALVDETSATKPLGLRGEARLMAERDWLSSGLPAHVFRVSGIYGPDASIIDQLRMGVARRINKQLDDGTPHVMNRIHIDDLVGALMASMQTPESGAIYNLSDDLPAPSAEVTAYAAQLLGIEAPALEVFNPVTMSPMQASFYAECKRVGNAKLKEKLGYSLRYPTYREGLSSLI